MHTCVNTYILTYMHACINTYIHTHMDVMLSPAVGATGNPRRQSCPYKLLVQFQQVV